MLDVFSLRPRPGQACPEAKKQRRAGAEASKDKTEQGHIGEEMTLGEEVLSRVLKLVLPAHL